MMQDQHESEAGFPDEDDHVAASAAQSLDKDRLLPIANVARLMKRALPANAKIAKDAKDCLQECVSEFISFVTSEASDRCALEKRKTVNGEDILWAMQSLGFDNYADTLKTYLGKYRESVKGDRSSGSARDENTSSAIPNASAIHAFEQRQQQFQQHHQHQNTYHSDQYQQQQQQFGGPGNSVGGGNQEFDDEDDQDS